jgi:hypothetical protein
MKIHFLHFGEFACATEIIVKETLILNVSVPFKIFSQQEIKQKHNSLSTCCCTLFVIVVVYREADASLIHSKTLSQNQNSNGSFYMLRLRFLSFIDGSFGFRIYKSVKKLFLGHGN